MYVYIYRYECIYFREGDVSHLPEYGEVSVFDLIRHSQILPLKLVFLDPSV